MFTDESRFNISQADGRVRVYIGPGEGGGGGGRRRLLVSFRETGLGVGALCFGEPFWGCLKTRLVVVHGNLNVQGYIYQNFVSDAMLFFKRQPHQVTMHGHTLSE